MLLSITIKLRPIRLVVGDSSEEGMDAGLGHGHGDVLGRWRRRDRVDDSRWMLVERC
jgi:hypothetical protein